MDTVNRVVPQIIERGSYQPPRLGITLDRQLNEIVRAKLGIEGVVIVEVQRGSGAEKAGLRGTDVGSLGDVIVQVDGRKVADMDDLMQAVDAHQAGDVVDVKIFRSGQLETVKVELQ